MSLIGEGGIGDTGTDPVTPEQDEFEALIGKLLPVLLEVAKASVTEAIAAVPVPVKRPGSVQGVDPTARTVTVLIDGDTTAIVAQCLIALPGLYDRVMVEFEPSGAVFVVGNQSASSFPAGFLAPYCGPVTAHAGAVPSSATSGEPPRGWLWCAGQAVNKADYAALFAAIGTTYNTGGEAATVFRVPDFRGRLPIGMDNMGGSDAGRVAAANTLGTTGGITTVVAHTHSTPSHSHSGSGLSVASHTHSFSATTSSDGSHTHTQPNSSDITGIGAFSAGGNTAANAFTASPDTGSGGSHTHTVSGTSGGTAPSVSGSTATDGSGTSGSTGSGTEQLPPYVIIHWLVKT